MVDRYYLAREDLQTPNTSQTVVAAHPVVGVRCWNPVVALNTSSGWEVPSISSSSLPDLRSLVSEVSDTVLMSNGGRVWFDPVWVPSLEPPARPLLVVSFAGTTKEVTKETGPLLKPGLLSSMLELQKDGGWSPYAGVDAKACTVTAYWNLGELRVTQGAGNQVVETSGSSTIEHSEPRRITIDVTGADVLHSAVFHQALYELDGRWPSPPSASWIFAFGTTLPAALAVWIAGVPMSKFGLSSLERYRTFFSEVSPQDANAENYTAFRYITEELGYGYGTRSTSVFLSMTVLLSYCIIVIGYIGYTLVTGSASTAWSSGVELITLALQSKQPHHLGHTGVGIDSTKTLRQGVGIRVNMDNEVELVFAQDRDFETRGLRKLERNTAY